MLDKVFADAPLFVSVFVCLCFCFVESFCGAAFIHCHCCLTAHIMRFFLHCFFFVSCPDLNAILVLQLRAIVLTM